METDKRKSIKAKILGVVFSSLLIITVALGYLSFHFSKNRIVNMLAEASKGIATTTANFIKPADLTLIQRNIDGIKERRRLNLTLVSPQIYNEITSSQKRGPDNLDRVVKIYERYARLLANVKNANKMGSPITVYVKERDRLIITLSSDPGILVGAPYQIRPEALKAISTDIPQTTGIYKDKDGTWISAFAPISSPDQADLQAVVEINNNIDLYVNKLRAELLAIVFVCLIGFLVTAVISYNLIENLAAVIRRLNEAASDLEEERYDLPIDIKSEDELGHLAQTFEKLRLSIRKKIEELRLSIYKEKKAHFDSIIALTNAIELRDPYTRQHLYRVDKYALLIARVLRLSKSEKEKLRYGAYLHDVGKIYVEDSLLKKTRISELELKEIKQHSEKGAKIVEGIPFLHDVKYIILSHQERYDGKGYPRGLKGEEIPFLARIISVADAFDAMTTDRPYRPKISFKEALNIIEKNSGTQFDPLVCEALLKYRNVIEEIATKHF